MSEPDDKLPTVLIVAGEFPPLKTIGRIRTAKFVEHLVGLGWRPIVIALEPSGREANFDAKLWGEVPAGADVVTPGEAVIIAGVAGVLVVFAVIFFERRRVDDPVGAISVHGVVGLLGLLLVPITNGENSSFTGQIIGAATIFTWVFVVSLVVWGILKAVIGIRVSEEDEYEGVDSSECGLEAYPEFTQAR